MTPERWSQIKEIFSAVMDRSAEERESAITEACQGDAELQAELHQLLAQHDEMGRFLDASASSATTLLNPGYLVAGRYEIVAFLGSGGMGEVYEVEDQELGGPIALKVIHPQMSFDHAVLERFRREVQLSRHVTHPNVCRVFDIGRHEQHGREIIFLTMELVPGETLSARLKRDGKIEPQEALAIAIQLCQALGAAHQAGILHRDFKCGNVMLIGARENVRAVVTDFGIARWMRGTQDSAGTVTTQGAIFGTPAYMSPEQLQGKELTTASDIYSLGLVLYEMVTGVRPFQGESNWVESLKRLTEDPVPPGRIAPGLGAAWSHTILGCLRRIPAERFASTEAVLASLQHTKRLADIFPYRKSMFAVAALLIALGLETITGFRGHLFPSRLPEVKRIAVLPFISSGNDPAGQAVADELAESLSGNLAHFQNANSSFWVVPWKNVQERPRIDEKYAGGALGVNLLVTGEFEKKGSRLVLRVKLKDATKLNELRSQAIEISENKIVTLEDTLLENISSMLQIQMPEGMLHHLPVDETSEPGAYEFYEQARGYFLRLTPDDTDRAIALFQIAIQKDPKFALAYASLAFAYSWKYHNTKDPAWHEAARKSCTMALALNDKLAYGHLALGMIQQDTGNLDLAIGEFRQALELDPADNEARNRLSLAYDKSGRLLEAETLLKDQIRHNPASWVNYNDLGYFYYVHAQYSQAEPLFRTAAQLAPDNPLAFRNLGAIYIEQGKYHEAESILAQAIVIHPAAQTYSNLGTAILFQGRYADSAAMFEKAVSLSPHDHRLWRNLGDAHMLAGLNAKANDAFATAILELTKILAVKPKDGRLLEDMALYHAKIGHKKEAQQALAQATRLSVKTPEFLFVAASVYELCAMRERALEMLHAAIQAGYSLSEIASAPELARLREDRRYSQIIAPYHTIEPAEPANNH